MRAHVSTYGDDLVDGVHTVKHWQLDVDGQFIADTAQPKLAELFVRIADTINGEVKKPS